MAINNGMSVVPIISIGTLAERLGVSVSTIRNYETEGLIISHRTQSGRRHFSMEDIKRIRIIQHLIQEVGLNIEGIRRLQAMLPCWEILPCKEGDQTECRAFKDKKKPCWMIKDLGCASGEIEKCRNCIVYRFGSQCIEDIKELVHNRKPGEKIREKIEAIVNQLD